MQGNIACAEGALSAGCRFMAGYPITPATEIAEHMARRLMEVGGTFIQMEDEISSMAAIVGSSWTGTKAMTATSGPGISLMLENIGYAIGTETPCVIVNVQRGAPTTGSPSVELQGDVVQPKRGSQGEYEIIALAPSSPQEMYDFTIEAFNLAERYRTPVFVLADAFVGHMREEVIIPRPDELVLFERKLPGEGFDAENDRGFLDEDVAPMPIFGRGFKSHVTSSCHDEFGRRNVTDAFALDRFIHRLRNKILKHRDDIVRTRSFAPGSEIVLVAYGTVWRCAEAAAQEARGLGLDVGTLKLDTLWPFPDREIRDLALSAKTIVVLENNMGQILPFVRAEAAGEAEVSFLPPETLGELHPVPYILERLKEIAG
jgi:2-oxoglutarate ferredoxin oxidoreductase subunit alpha